MKPLAIRLSGAVEALRDGAAVPLGGRRVRALLAVLALAPGRAVPADALATRVWDDGERPDRPRAAVQTLIARLRVALGGDAVVTEQSGYRLDVAREAVDLLALGDACDRAAAAGSPDQERALLTQALAGWAGPPFGEELSDWLGRHEAPLLVGEYLRAVERRVDLDLAAGDHARCAAELRALIQEHPLRETLWSRLIRALRAEGRIAEALEEYERVRRHLADELGVDPSPPLQELHLELLHGAAEPAPPARPGTVPRQLPAALPGFVGREGELRRLDAVMLDDDGGRRLVALHGPGGSGKTSLALQWAHRAAATFPDGQIYLNLRGFGREDALSPPDAVELMLRSIGMPGDVIPADPEERSGLLRSELADRRVLIVLDNARDAGQVRPLLPGGSGAVLVTSRSQLRGLVAIDGAVPIPVGPMSPQEATDLIRHRLRPPTRDEAALAHLAELCGHLPIALAVATERVAREGPDTLRDLIGRLQGDRARLGELSTGDDPLTDVRDIFAGTYRSVDPAAAALFRQLALHPEAPISTGAAGALAGAPPDRAARSLDALVERHLLQPLRPGWFEIHDLARDYSVELLGRHEAATSAATDDAAARRRLHSWYVHSAEAACLAIGRYPALIDPGPLEPGAGPETFRDPRQAHAWMSGHRRALTRTVHQAAEVGDHLLVCRLAPRLSYYLSLLAARSEALALNELALSSALTHGEDMMIAGAANNLGIARGRRGEFDEADDCFRLALRHGAAAGHDETELRVKGNLGLLLDVTGRHEDAVTALTTLLGEHQERGSSPEQITTVLLNLANAHLHCGRPDQALRTGSEGLEAARAARFADPGARALDRIGSAHEGVALDNIGSAHQALGDLDAACAAFEAAAAIYRGLGSLSDEIHVLRELAEVEYAAGRPEAARRALVRCRHMLDEARPTGGTTADRERIEDLLATIGGGPPPTRDERRPPGPAPGTSDLAPTSRL